MDYKMIENEKIPRPTSSFASYKNTTEQAIRDFALENRLIEAIDKSQFTLAHYHGLLRAIFHQVYYSSTSFGLGGAMSSSISIPVRSYLFHHAEEEKDHWIWILEDLKSTGYKGPDMRATFPNWAAQGYLSYGVYLAFFNPIARLAMANTLEGISGSFGLSYGGKAIRQLGLTKDNAKFFLLHGELDQGHTQDIMAVLENESLTGEQWAELEHVARTTSQLYKNIYNYAFDTAGT